MDTTREQFEKEAEALTGLIASMIEAGQTEEAAQLIEQYALLNPSDPKIAQLRGKLEAGNSMTSSAKKERAAWSEATITAQGDLESIFVVAWLAKKRSGFFTSIFNKIRLMEEQLGYTSTILTTRHDAELRKTEVWLKTFTGSSEVMSPKTKIVNVYEYFQGSYKEGLKNKAIYSSADEEKNAVKNKMRYEQESDGIYALYKDNTLIRRDIYCGYSGSLRTEQFQQGGKVIQEVIYDDWGYLNCIKDYDPHNSGRYTAKYYRTADETLCIEAFFDTAKEENDPLKIILYDNDGNAIKQLVSNEELAALYLTQTNSKDKHYLIVFETGTVGRIAEHLDKSQKNIVTISMIHSIFLKNAYNPKSGPQSYYEYVCNNPDKMDGIVFLTKEEQNDFAQIYGRSGGTYVIPHPYPYPIEKVSFETRDRKKAVVISRFFPEKQIDITIDIFAEVVKQLPEARLEIYGIGPEQEAIEAYIKKKKMEKNIFIMGYTDDAISIYRTAALHIMTSIAEGYGLTLMESICNGCPAFAYDIKYGPSDIIKDGETGFLFPLGDKKQFAAKITGYLRDEEMQRSMSENCYNEAPRFGTEKFLKNWLDMVKALIPK